MMQCQGLTLKGTRCKNISDKRCHLHDHKMLAQTGGGPQSLTMNEDGDIVPIDGLHKGKPFFRKRTDERELRIVKLLKRHPHKNIVKIYNVDTANGVYDTELVDTTHVEDKAIMKSDLSEAKTHLQSLGIAYIDWKDDNMGLGVDGHYKVYDFDMSSQFNLDSHDFDRAALQGWIFNEAQKEGLRDIVDIDNWAFEQMFTRLD